MVSSQYKYIDFDPLLESSSPTNTNEPSNIETTINEPTSPNISSSNILHHYLIYHLLHHPEPMPLQPYNIYKTFILRHASLQGLCQRQPQACFNFQVLFIRYHNLCLIPNFPLLIKYILLNYLSIKKLLVICRLSKTQDGVNPCNKNF